MTPDRAAIDAVTKALDAAARTCLGLDHGQAATVAITTLQGLGWRPPRRRPDTNADEAWAAYEKALTHINASMGIGYDQTEQP